MNSAENKAQDEAGPFRSGLPPLIMLLRPHQWTKNLLCYAGTIFGGRLLEPDAWLADTSVFVIFCAAASFTYVLNDLHDRGRDRHHPKKKRRPLASGEITVSTAVISMAVLLTGSLAGASLLGWQTMACVGVYIAVNLAYSSILKHSLLLDVGCLSAGYVLRLLAGVYALGDIPTAWIFLCTLFLSMFLGFAKRRVELAASPQSDHQQRPVLLRYSLPYLDSVINNTAAMSVVSYALFTTTSGKNPSLVITVPIVYYAIMHYKHLVMVLNRGEEPEMILLRDRPIQISIILWLACFIVIVYGQLHLFR